MEHVPISDGTKRPIGPDQVINAIDALNIHRQTLKAIGNLTGDWEALDTANLLKIGELSDFHTVEPDLPTETPSPQCGRLPVVLYKTDIMRQRINTNGL